MAVKVKIKMTGADAKRAAKSVDPTSMGMKDASGSNYVSQNRLHVGFSDAPPQAPVKAVKNRDLSDEHPDTWRRKSNSARDQRTKLGRGKSSNITL